MKAYNIYLVWKNEHTLNWDGTEWIVDGKRGRVNYPGDLDLSAVIDYYKNGIDYKEEGKKDDRT